MAEGDYKGGPLISFRSLQEEVSKYTKAKNTLPPANQGASDFDRSMGDEMDEEFEDDCQSGIATANRRLREIIEGPAFVYVRKFVGDDKVGDILQVPKGAVLLTATEKSSFKKLDVV